MEVSIIVAVAENGVIGRDGQLPWRLSDDLKRFRSLTMDNFVVLGRRTWESIGKPLPGRRMVVVSRQTDYKADDDVIVVRSFEDALNFVKSEGSSQVFVMGGAEIYNQAIHHASKLYLTRVHANVVGDAYFRNLDESRWKKIQSEPGKKDERNEYAFTFELYESIVGNSALQCLTSCQNHKSFDATGPIPETKSIYGTTTLNGEYPSTRIASSSNFLSLKAHKLALVGLRSFVSVKLIVKRLLSLTPKKSPASPRSKSKNC